MGKEKRHPSWWQLYLLLPVLGVLGLVEARVSLSTAGHRIVEVGIVLVVFGLVAAWLRANEPAMLREIDERGGQMARSLSEKPFVPSSGFSVDINSNGNGHRRSAWYRPEPAALFVDPEEGQDE